MPFRQNSNIMHELAHLILDHEPARVDMTSERLMILDSYDKTQEDEANWLSGALLVPREGLLHVLSRNSLNESAASHFKVSEEMIAWRRQVTGVDVQIRRRSPSAGA
jgi:Zn-dependent peptidase ImmA (M78 family)